MIIPVPIHDESDRTEVKETKWIYVAETEARIQRFLSMNSKKCPKCNLVNHGWNKRCYCGHVWHTSLENTNI